jgi:ankyrin repeat protein
MRVFRQAACTTTTWLHLAAAICAADDTLPASAAENNDSEAIPALLDTKSAVNGAQADGMTALHWASHHDDSNLVRELIAVGADPNVTSRYGVTPLSLACTNGNTATVESLLTAGADPNSSLPGGETVLMTASRTGRVGPVEALLRHGAKVNAQERKKQTALMWAAAAGNVEVVDALLRAGADFRTPLSSGFTPFFFAVREGRTDVALRLIQAGVNVNDIMRPEKEGGSSKDWKTTALLLAIENGHFELAAALLKVGADPNARPAGFTALHAITWVRKPMRGDGNPAPIGSGNMSSLEIVRQLVAHDADTNARLESGTGGRGEFTTTGSTPFLLTARTSDVLLMRLLLELGADADVTNADDCPPLLAAAGVGALGDGEEAAGTEDEASEAVRLLVELGANVNAVDKNGETAMHGAAYQSRPKVVRLLAERGADIRIWNRQNKAGWTPLMIAQGHRPHNFRPAPDTIAAIEDIMRARGVEPPKAGRDINQNSY